MESNHQPNATLKHVARPRRSVSLAGLPTSRSMGTTSLDVPKRCPRSAEHPWQKRREGPSSTTAGPHRVPGPVQRPLSLLPPVNGVSSPAGGGTEAAAVGSGTALPLRPTPGTLAFLVPVSMTSPLGACSDRRRGAAISRGRRDGGTDGGRATTAVGRSAGGRRCIYYFHGCEAPSSSFFCQHRVPPGDAKDGGGNPWGSAPSIPACPLGPRGGPAQGKRRYPPTPPPPSHGCRRGQPDRHHGVPPPGVVGTAVGRQLSIGRNRGRGRRELVGGRGGGGGETGWGWGGGLEQGTRGMVTLGTTRHPPTLGALCHHPAHPGAFWKLFSPISVGCRPTTFLMPPARSPRPRAGTKPSPGTHGGDKSRGVACATPTPWVRGRAGTPPVPRAGFGGRAMCVPPTPTGALPA